MAVCMSDGNGKPIQIIINVYMPFYNGSTTHTESFLETIDILQGFVDNYGCVAPLKVVGDYNVQLPHASNLNKKWFKGHKFNRHSAIMYDFLTSNNLLVADILSRQRYNYTYFCHKNNVYTWIDHVASSRHDIDNMLFCNIMPHVPLNTSDHLPITFGLRVSHPAAHVTSPHSAPRVSASCNAPHINWNAAGIVQKYRDCLDFVLTEIPLDYDGKNGDAVHSHIQQLNSAMHDAAASAVGGASRRVYRPKAFWCPELTVLRDRKRFWWHLWVDNGRPRQGVIFDCYKGVKKLFRKVCRNRIDNILNSGFSQINNLFKARQLTTFWNKLKVMQRKRISSSLTAECFGSFYRNVMSDDTQHLTDFQKGISQNVKDLYARHSGNAEHVAFTDEHINKAILSLRTRVSPGFDGISAEHFIHGNCELLRRHLASLYNNMLIYNVVPDILSTGVIIPILKKATADPNSADNYRPITLSSTHGKILEILMMPDTGVNDNQFGFRPGRSTAMACNAINDVISFCNFNNSPVFICSMDAAKCFDSIWHDGLFYKLRERIPLSHWVFLYKWYSSMNAIVKWNSQCSASFPVQRGTKQGSILSPTLFNIFIDDLITELSQSDTGIMVGNYLFNSVAYADDIDLLSLTTCDLQNLIDICFNYAKLWRFSFGIKKTKCMVAGRNLLKSIPTWHLGQQKIDTVDSLEILGVTFSSSLSANEHIEKRIQSSRRAMYSLSGIGCSYPGGLSSDVKAHLWKTIGVPSLVYGVESINVTSSSKKRMECTQASTVKRIVGIRNRSHHTHLLHALNVPQISTIVSNNVLSLWHRIFNVPSPARSICAKLLSDFMLSDQLIPGTLLHRVVTLGHSPVKCMLSRHRWAGDGPGDIRDGVVDSLRYLVMHENFLKPYSDEHVLVTLLTKAF